MCSKYIEMAKRHTKTLHKVTINCLKKYSVEVIYSVNPKPDRWDFVNIEKYKLLMVRFIKVIHPSRYGEM